MDVFAKWSTSQRPGGGIDVSNNGKPVARFVFGESELKPYLHVFGPNGELLTDWSAEQRFPHHRGIFIGWNKIRADGESSDLWHLRRGEKMIVREAKSSTSATGAVITAAIEWHAAEGKGLLVKETRTLAISQPAPEKTQVDAHFVLTAARDLSLDGDLQHAGIHFRASREVAERESETKYLWEPDRPGENGRVRSTELKWCRLIFPIGNKTFTATELNAPGNPVEELSWRAYGRFGFFFKKDLSKDESLDVRYRFITQPSSGRPVAEERKDAANEYARYAAATRYEVRAKHDPNGIGKFYLGREIAHVMGHQGADWLERPERASEENPDRMVELLELRKGDHVADIGAGTGYISWRMAQRVGPEGKVYAVDIQPEMLELLEAQMKKRGLKNVVPVLGGVSDPKLPPASIDLAIMVDVYHELEQPAEMLENIFKALKPGGRIAFVEYRAEDPNVPIKNVHKMSEAQVKKEAAAAGLQWEKTYSDLPWQHLIIVKKP